VTARVVLVPGLWMPATVMAPLGARLARRGYATSRFHYPSRRPIEGARECSFYRARSNPFMMTRSRISANTFARAIA